MTKYNFVNAYTSSTRNNGTLRFDIFTPVDQILVIRLTA